MRVKNSIINISVGLGNQIIITLLSFFSRTVFIQTLGIEYLGVNGLFTSVLAMLTLAEAGIGSSIIYSLFKPVADNDIQKINALMRLYKRAYAVIAAVVFVLGLALMPFLHLFVKDTHVEGLHLIYFIFLINTVIPYLFQYKSSFLNVNQKGYIATAIFSVSSILSLLLKIGILYYTNNYILYLVTDCVITLINSAIVAVVVNRMYPFLRDKTKSVLDPLVKQDIIKNVKAIVLQNIGTYLIFGTDNIIISSFVSVAAVGLYSNYNMLIEICRTFINQVFNNIYHSIGNLVASESAEKIFSVYKVYWLVNFWLYGFFTIFLYVVTEPFIKLWLGPSFLMENSVLIVIMIVFFERGMRNAISTVKNTAGIFHEDRYAPLVQAAINLGFSVWLVQVWGIAGVFLGTLISAVLVPIWRTPYLVYKKVFHKPFLKYVKTYVLYALIGLTVCAVTKYVCSLIPAGLGEVPHLAIIVILAIVIPNAIFVAIFHKTAEFAYIWTVAKGIVETMLGKFRRAGVNKKAENA
ncbi:lipopolysaccharide biosynthesis protein [Paenibacillus chartarius]|uniref:Lipopolysaccharide biosynthesis protein n=1 Tax=Paenibacillus chartarius TaxID=747481 RepID=A0ABV6DUZ1_9BACL